MPESTDSNRRTGIARTRDASLLQGSPLNIHRVAAARAARPLRRNTMRKSGLALGLAAFAMCGVAGADINVGVTLSATGPAASLGIPEKNTIEMLGSPTIAGQKIHFVVLDDKSDTTEAVNNTRKLISAD
jgi:ABC-type branched-subunit amino acid transport system substrate-binding protein